MLNLRELIQDKDLTKRFETIEKVMREDYLPVWYIHCPHYTDHGSAHCEGVEAKLNELIPDDFKKELNEYEIFFLLSAVWLHDVGMTGFDDYEGFTREKHHELGRALIRKDQIKGIFLDEHEKMVLGELIFGHCATLIDEIKEITRIERKNKKNETIRIRILACLLRLADVCDASHNRASGVILACKGVDPISKAHHELHQRVSSIEFDNDSNKIIVHAIVKSEKDKELLEKTIINDIQKELCISMKILHPEITYNVVELKINYDTFKNEIIIPSEFNEQLQFHSCFKCVKKLGPSQICVPMYEKKPDLAHKIEHFDDVATKKSKIPVLFGSSDVVKLQETFNSRWITTFNVIETLSFKEIKKSLEEGLPAIIVGNRDSGKTSFVYEMLKKFLLNNWHVAVYEKDETLEEEDFKTNSPLLIAVDDLHAFEITEQDEIFKLYKKALKNNCGFLVTYRLENENDIGNLWSNEISQINTKCVLPDLSKKELKQIIEVHSKERGVAVSEENIEHFAWQVSKYSNMPAHIAYSFLQKEKGDTFSSDDIKKIPLKLNELIESIIMKLDKYGEKVMASFKIFNILDGGDSRFVFKEELKYVFSKVNNGFSDVDFSLGINSLLKLGMIQEIDSTIFTTPKEGFLDQISLELNKIDINTIKRDLKKDYLKIFKLINLNHKEDNQTYSIALLSIYERIRNLKISVIDFVNILLSKNKELARVVIFKKASNESKDIQKIIIKAILPYLKQLKNKKIEDLYQLAGVYDYLDDIDNKIAIAHEILLKNPKEAKVYHLLGHIFSDAGKHNQAIECMEKASSIDPHNFACLGNVYMKAGNGDKAIEFANKAIKLDSKDDNAYHVLGHVFSNAKEHTRAIKYMEKAAILDPANFACLGEVYQEAGNNDKAIESYKKAIEHNPKKVSAFHTLGHIFSDSKEHNLAIKYMENAVILDPKYFICLGEVYWKAGNTDKAIESYNKAIDQNPKTALAYYRLGQIFSDTGKHNQAIEYMEKAANLDPEYLDNLGFVCHSAGSMDKSIESLKKAIEFNPNNFEAYSLLGSIYSDELHNYKEAINYFNKCLEINSQANEIKANLIEVFLSDGRYEDVNIYATEILDSSKDDNLNLNVHFLVLCSKFFNGREFDKKKLISDFLEYYEALPKDFENTWVYKGIIHMIRKADLSKNNRKLLISLIDILEKKSSIDKFKRTLD